MRALLIGRKRVVIDRHHPERRHRADAGDGGEQIRIPFARRVEGRERRPKRFEPSS
jgi:hypothetical protein